jgi:MFS family permease
VTTATDSGASWRALAGCGVLAMFSVSALYGATFGLFLRPLQQSLGWSRAEIAFSLTLITLVGPAVVPITGWIIDNVPLRPLVLWGVVLQSANLAAFGFLGSDIWVYYGLVFALMFTAAGPSILTLAKVVQGWFDKSLGRAMGILFACGAVGGIIHPLWVQAVITHSGWRDAFMTMGALCLVIGGGAAWWLVRQAPTGDVSPASATSQLQQPTTQTPMSMAAFMRDIIWWKLALWNMLFAFGSGAIFIHFAALLQDRGAAPAQAAIAMSLVGVGGLVGNLLAGWLVDRWSASRMAVLLMLAPMTAALMLYAGGSLALAVSAGGILGLCAGSDHSLSAFLTRRYFEPGIFGRASATQMLAATAGGGVSPWLSGLLHDRTGNYDVALLLAAGAFGAAAVVAWWLPDSRESAVVAQAATPV